MLAAKMAGTLDASSELARIPMPTDVASHGLGITIRGDDGSDENSVIIEAGTPLPAFAEEGYAAASDGQTHVRLRINEGDDSDLAYCRELGQGDALFGRPVPLGYPIRVSIGYNEQQIVEVKAYDGETGAEIGTVTLQREGTLADGDLQVVRDRIQQMDVN